MDHGQAAVNIGGAGFEEDQFLASFGVGINDGGAIGKEETTLMMQTKDSLYENENFAGGNETNKSTQDLKKLSKIHKI